MTSLLLRVRVVARLFVLCCTFRDYRDFRARNNDFVWRACFHQTLLTKHLIVIYNYNILNVGENEYLGIHNI